jgi:hypothetical protein
MSDPTETQLQLAEERRLSYEATQWQVPALVVAAKAFSVAGADLRRCGLGRGCLHHVGPALSLVRPLGIR